MPLPLPLLFRAVERTVTVGTGSGIILRRNPSRIWAGFTNDGAVDVYIRIGEAAALNTGILLSPGGSFTLDQYNMPWQGEVYAIASASCVLTGVEVEREP